MVIDGSKVISESKIVINVFKKMSFIKWRVPLLIINREVFDLLPFAL